jgi:hypothetical protein
MGSPAQNYWAWARKCWPDTRAGPDLGSLKTAINKKAQPVAQWAFVHVRSRPSFLRSVVQPEVWRDHLGPVLPGPALDMCNTHRAPKCRGQGNPYFRSVGWTVGV